MIGLRRTLIAPAGEGKGVPLFPASGGSSGRGGSVAVPRPFPYPFKAMLAVCSDLDETPDETTFLETIRFLNSVSRTSFGRGVGLEVGNTIYFDMPPGHFSYWSASDKGREILRALIRSGHIDCLHSFGDLATTRSHAERALEELDRHGCHLSVWVDHAVSPTNFGPDIMRGSGDVPASPAYHADLTLAYGIRYVWMGRVTSVIGQDISRRLGGIFAISHPLSSAVTLSKEAAKGLIGRAVGGRYAMHKRNEILRRVTLRDGTPCLEFLRCNPHWGGVSSCDTADGLGQVLTPRFLDLLEERGGMCILYTHLGKFLGRPAAFSEAAVNALEMLAERGRSGRILVTTTKRLLDYALARRTHRFRGYREGEWTIVRIEREEGVPCPPGGGGMEGATFYVDDPGKTRVFLGGREIPDVQRNPPDATGRGSVSIPWKFLSPPDL